MRLWLCTSIPFLPPAMRFVFDNAACCFPEKMPALGPRAHRCFGLNGFGQLGQGDTDARGDSAATMGDNLGPVDLGTGAVVVDMAAGSDHTCVVLDQGEVKVIYLSIWRLKSFNRGKSRAFTPFVFLPERSVCRSRAGVATPFSPGARPFI